MSNKPTPCPGCGHDLDANGLCHQCDDPAPKWLVYAVYGLLGLFVVGLVYRLVWP